MNWACSRCGIVPLEGKPLYMAGTIKGKLCEACARADARTGNSYLPKELYA